MEKGDLIIPKEKISRFTIKDIPAWPGMLDQLCYFNKNEDRSQILGSIPSNLLEAHARWEVVRHNPPLLSLPSGRGTGFEGYLVGNCWEGEEALEILEKLGENVLNNLVKLYQHDQDRLNRIVNCLFIKDKFSFKELFELNSIFGALLGRMRADLLRNDNFEGQRFRQETIKIVQGGIIDYRLEDNKPVEEIEIKMERKDNFSPLLLKNGEISKELTVIREIGKVGEPLVRTWLNRCLKHEYR